MALANPALPPGGLFELVFSFDTTGSMSRAIDEVKGRLQDMIQRLQSDIPGIRIGLIAHGDYCDKDVFYLEKHQDLCTDVAQLCQFVQDVEGTWGGDPEECYEYVLHMARGFSWSPASQRALVLIGDATPHGPEYELNTDNLEWREEARQLANMGVKVYGVQAFEDADSSEFFEEIAELTAGHHLKLGDFSHICDFIMAICYRERGEEFLDGYEAEVRAREARMGLHPGLEGMFGTLRKESSTSSVRSNQSNGGPSTSGVVVRPSPLPRKMSSLSSVSSNNSASDVIARVMPIPRKISSLSSITSASGSGEPVVNHYPGTKQLGAKRPPKKDNAPKLAAEARKLKRAVKGVRKPTINTSAKKVKFADSTDGKSVKKSDKAKEQKRDFRCKVPDSRFSLMKGNMAKRWSNWKLVVTNSDPGNKKQWRARKNATGWSRRGLLFRPIHPGSKFFYEFAVQGLSTKKYIFYHKTSAMDVDANTNWEKMLLRAFRPRQEVGKLLDKNYKLFMRRMLLKGMGKRQRGAVKELDRQYIYHWNTNNYVHVL